MHSRPLTPEEVDKARRELIAEIIWKLKLLTEDELADLKKQLGDEEPDLLAEIQRS